ncbi:hypothetical protein EMIHUDRAFT_122986 [Emiliania huxleyi CCMP1516]|uniref:FAD-binding domain-containing protein n=2 Tax=Emiliania huxleyi TaxID=2903 RepID=A0A0D3K9K8_EMIH1|nr:hypothetical protein EMIHUDRAFT_122986 [Emiliania huxleyi CCMP1516]EOD32443.1 hypothetical protein EMIHUDRAFT_122986 [Emiliania huxleyi CCMP1516]|eukprot:XP_005784872.1 hypothetical protein EMIHUDRAFT_122986 [Emiliania huxleyi CCMP1516]
MGPPPPPPPPGGRGDLFWKTLRTTQGGRPNHACYYPTGDGEQIFQLYFPADTPDDAWGALSADEGLRQCSELAAKLEGDGWDASFVEPLRSAENVIRVGLFAREPLDAWATPSGRVILLGDAAHPPVPYIGQGAMMAMEDVGVLARLLKHHCRVGAAAFDPSDASLSAAAASYQALRIPRVRTILGSSHTLGKTQQVADLITAAGASAPADAVFGGRFATGETPRSTTSASEADEGDGVGGDGGTNMHFDLFEPDRTPMEDL